MGEYKRIFEEKKKTENELMRCLRVCRMRLAGERAKTEELGNKKKNLQHILTKSKDVQPLRKSRLRRLSLNS